MVDEYLAGAIQPDAARHTLKDRRAQFFLKGENASIKRRRYDSKLVSGATLPVDGAATA